MSSVITMSWPLRQAMCRGVLPSRFVASTWHKKRYKKLVNHATVKPKHGFTLEAAWSNCQQVRLIIKSCWDHKPDWILGCLTLTPLHTTCIIKMFPAKSNLACECVSQAQVFTNRGCVFFEVYYWQVSSFQLIAGSTLIGFLHCNVFFIFINGSFVFSLG